MDFPEMIFFDYGHTLIYEAGFNGMDGAKAILKYARYNKHNLSYEDVSEFSTRLFNEIGLYARNNGIEIHQHMFQQMLYEYLDIDIDLTPLEMERIFWDHASPGKPMPHTLELLDYLNTHHIRTGVISNISFSGEALTERINRLLPNNKFEFIMASSEYVYRKPNPILFEIALKKANLIADKVWFCGDNPIADIQGAAATHIYPVWYENPLKCPYHTKDLKPSISESNYLHITDWTELIQLLENTSFLTHLTS